MNATGGEQVRQRLESLISHRLVAAWDVLEERGVLEEPLFNLVRTVGNRYRRDDSWRTAWEDEVLHLFERAGIDVLALKGAALARWLYTAPEQRPRSDLDLLIKCSDRKKVSALLRKKGFEKGDDVVSMTQAAWRKEGARPGRVIDLHWKLSDQPVFHSAFTFEELWLDSVPIRPANGHEHTRRLSRPWSLIHAIVHFWGGDPDYEPPRLWLLDITLLWESLDQHDRQQFLDICRDRGLSGLAASAFCDCRQFFRLDIDPKTVHRLTREGTQQWQTALVKRSTSRMRNLLLALRGQPGLREKVTYLRSIAFPPDAYMRQKYPEGSPLGLFGLYFRRILGMDKLWKTSDRR